jgi:hypothetical protein
MKVYGLKVTYGFETEKICFTCNVKNGWVVQTPESHPWIRGQHLETILPFFVNIKPLRLAPSRES